MAHRRRVHSTSIAGEPMVAPASKPFALSLARARRIWLRAQRLDEPEPFGDGPAATRAAVEHLGYVQIDTIHVVERCHHQILYTRIPAYRRDDLHRAQTVDKTVFEYWTHALSYVPTRDLRFFVAAMARHRRRPVRWLASVDLAEVRRLVARIHKRGPLTLRDIDDEVLLDRGDGWGSRKPSKRALQLAFYRGQLTISERTGMLKTYELAGRHFGWTRPPRAAPERERLDYLLDRGLRSQGVVSLDSLYLDAGTRAAMRRLIDARTRRGELVPVAVEGAAAAHWARPETVEAELDPLDDLVHILSPFDPLVHQRRRLQLFFGYQHRFEAYVPREKRVLGYFAQPVLLGDRIVAALDLKTDRERGRLLIQKWTWMARGARRPRKQLLEEALARFERFQLAD